jgi:hypothetical protein
VRVRELGSRPAPASIRELLSRMVRGHGPTVQVERRVLPYWQERGWSHNGNTYMGRYQTQHGAFLGEIVQHSGNRIEFFLHEPSEQIQRHSHWACFQHRGNRWYLVHMGRRPADVSSGIITIERLITEAYKR